MNIDLKIDNLILHGFPSTDRAQIAAAVQRELTRLLAERGVPPSLAQGASLPQIDSVQFQITPGARADAIGRQVAQQIYEGLQGD